MDGLIGKFIRLMLLQVLGRPVRIGEKGEETVHHDPEQHGGGPQGIEVVVAGGSDHGGIFCRCCEGGQEGSRESSLDPTLRAQGR